MLGPKKKKKLKKKLQNLSLTCQMTLGKIPNLFGPGCIFTHSGIQLVSSKHLLWAWAGPWAPGVDTLAWEKEENEGGQWSRVTRGGCSESVPGRRSSKCKDPEAGRSSVC